MKSKFYYPYIKFSLWAAIAFFLLTALTAIILRLTVKPSDLEKWIVRVVSEQTGGKLEFKVEHFDILNHIRIRDIAFTGPATDLGFNNGGELAREPLIRVNQIEIIPKLTAIWRGAGKIKLFHIERPQVTLNLTPSEDNLSGLIRYRAKHYPSEEKITPWYELPKLPFQLDQIFIPAVVSLEELRISDLQLKFSSDHLTVSFGPALITANMSASGKKINLSAGISSLPSTLELMFKGKPYIWKLALDNKFLLNSWTEFELKGKNTIKGSYLKRPLKSDYLLRAKLANDLSGINLKELAVEITNSLKTSGYANLQTTDHKLLNLQTAAEFKGTLNLDNPLTQILTELTGLKTNGQADFQLNVHGENQIDQNFIPTKLANASLLFNSRDVNILYSKMIDVKDLNLNSSLDVESKDGDIVLHPKTNLSFTQFKLDVQDLSVYLNRLKLSFESLFSAKKLKVNDFKLISDLENADLRFQNKSILNEPFHFGLTAKSKEKLGDLQTSGDGSLGKLVKLGLSASCSDPCARPKLEGWTRAERLTPIMELVRSRVPLQFKKFVPSYFEGLASGDFQILFDTPDPKKGVSLKKLNLDWMIKAEISKLDFKIPFYSTAVDRFDFKIFGNGKADRGNIKTSASLGLIQLNPTPTRKLSLKKNEFKSETEIRIADPAKLPQSLQSTTEWGVSNDQLEMSAGLVFPDNVASGIIKTEGLSQVIAELKKSTILGGGFQSQFSLKTDLETKVLESTFALSCYPEFLVHYIEGLKSSGSAEMTGALSLKNWEDLSLIARGKFNKLSSDYAINTTLLTEGNQREEGSTSNPKPFNVKIEMVHGTIPISINEKISEVIRIFEKKDPLLLKDRIRSYLASDARLNEISLPENNLVAWKDANANEKNYLKVRNLLLNGVGLNELDVALEVSSKGIIVKNYAASFLNGKLEGAAFIPLSPFPERVMLASHVAGINSALVPQLLGKSFGKKKAEPISGNFHLDYFVRSNLIDGVFDLTSIGADQMLYLLELIDPDHADPAMNNVRRALGLGSLKKATATIKRGELALDLDVRVAAIPIPLPSLGGIKVSNVIDNLKADLFPTKVTP